MASKPTMEEEVEQAHREYENLCGLKPGETMVTPSVKPHEEPMDDTMFDYEDEEVEAEVQPAPPGHFENPASMARGFGSAFMDVLHRLLEVLEPFAAIKDPSVGEKVFSNAARIRMTDQTKKATAALWDELHEAIYLDKRIKFRKADPKPAIFTYTKGFSCTCEMIHAAVVNCPHHTDAHIELCREATRNEEKEVYDKRMVSKMTQTDKTISPTMSRSSSVKSEERVSPRGRGFSRGGKRGNNARNESRGREYNNNRGRFQDRSRSRFERNRSPRRSPRRDYSPRRASEDRGREEFRRPSQPAQDRLLEERKRMEEPLARKRAEAEALLMQNEATSAHLRNMLEKAAKMDAGTMPRRRPKVGESALRPNGEIDYDNPPIMTLPEGMEARFNVVNNIWEVSIVSVGTRNVQN